MNESFILFSLIVIVIYDHIVYVFSRILTQGS